MNEYNNSGVSADSVWVDHFNAALVEMADDLDLQESFTLSYSTDKRVYTLPDDYYSLLLLTTENKQRIAQRREYDSQTPGYWVMDKGSRHEVDVVFPQATILTGLYQRYPANLEVSSVQTQKPEIPTAGETALCYLAISKALLNNNQPGQAKYFIDLYTAQRANVRLATTKAKGV
jgi:hypothetical protein